MAKKQEWSKEEILADLIFLLNQSMLIEHEQDFHQITQLCRKYGIDNERF